MAERTSEKRTSSRLLVLSAYVVGGLFLSASAAALALPRFLPALPFVNAAILIAAAAANRILLRSFHVGEDFRAQEAAERERILTEALCRAEAGDRTRRSIISNMTHEFRTPLNSVIGFAELLADGESDDERAEMARCVQRSGWELLDLVNSLVKAAELSNAEYKPHDPVEFRLEEIIEETAAAFKKEIEAKGLGLAVSCLGDKPLYGDMESISAILGMLTANAVKYSDSGTIGLSARELSVSDGERITAEFVVADQGRGMEEETLKRLFQPFDQGETPLIKRFPGAGVGLYSAKRLTEAIRGDLRIESEKGRGTKAFLIVPLEKRPERRE